MRATSERICTRSFASRLDSGSSIRNTFGWRTIARPIATRRRRAPHRAFRAPPPPPRRVAPQQRLGFPRQQVLEADDAGDLVPPPVDLALAELLDLQAV